MTYPHVSVLFFLQYFPKPNLYAWLIYLIFIVVFFIIVKIINARLHQMFDTTECVKEIIQPNNAGSNSPNGGDDNDIHIHIEDHRPSFEGLSARFRGTSTIVSSSVRSTGFHHQNSSSLNAEVNAIEMEDLSCKNKENSTKNTAVSSCNTPPGSLTDLTSSKADQVQVELHNKSFNAEPAASSSGEQQQRRFSNLSNLARSLPSNSSIDEVNMSGSVDYLTSTKNKERSRSSRSAKENVRRTQSDFNSVKVQQAASAVIDDDTENGEIEPLLMKRHQSLDENRRRDLKNPPNNAAVNASSRSLDRFLDDSRRRRKSRKQHQQAVKNEGKVLDEDMATFQAELDDASQALLNVSQCKFRDFLEQK